MTEVQRLADENVSCLLYQYEFVNYTSLLLIL